MKKLFLIFFSFASVSISAQQLSVKPSPDRVWMDTVIYPPAEYGSSILYTLVKPYYLSEQQVQLLAKSVKAPANSSDETRRELDYLLELESKRTPEQLKRVEFLGNIGYWPAANILNSHPSYQQNLRDLFFEGREVLGDHVTAEKFPAIANLLKGVMNDMRIMEFTIKYKVLRPRPYHLEPKLHPVERMTSPSFASGHTMWAYAQALTWSLVVPAKENDFLKLAEEIRKSREIMGIHYPSDNDASKQVASGMLHYYSGNKQFQKDLKSAREEWKMFSSSK